MTGHDETGRGQLVKNVLTSWLSQLVFIAFGFVLPRVIHESIGQVSLGIWDFGWTVVSYLSIAMVGIGASVNRYVARYRATGETDKLSAAVSSVTAVQVAIASSVFTLVLVLYYFTPRLMREQLGSQATLAATIVLYLGASLSVQMMFDAFRGIMTGCHRWTAHNTLNAGSYAIAGAGMLLILLNGGGLAGMAKVYLIVTVLTELVRYRIARKICPEIDLSRKNVHRADIKKMVKFGLKNVLIYLPKIVVQQTVNVFVIANLGPAMLAILARPLALVTHIFTLINKFAFVLTPIAGSLQGSGKADELKVLAVKTMRAGWFLAIIPTTYLAVLGDRFIELWMGLDYVNLKIVVILALGSIFPMSQRALVTIIIGMNEHGRLAKYSLVVSAVLVVTGIAIVSTYGWSLTAAALLIVLPSNFGMATVALLVGCKVLNIGVKEYFDQILRQPLFLMIVSFAGLYLARTYGPQEAFLSLVVGAVVHGGITAVLLRQEIQLVTRIRQSK